MALTDNRVVESQRPDMAFPRPPQDVAASQTIYRGAFVAFDGSGNLIPAPATGANTFAGVADTYYLESTASPTTDKPVRLQPIAILKHAVTGAVDTNIGEKVYYTADDTLSMTIVPTTGVAGSQVGRLHGFHKDGTPLVDMTKIEY
jgi:hypothetical protein